MATPRDVMSLAKDAGAQIVDLRFCDLPGLMQHFSIPASELSEDDFDSGFGFDGSSIRGFQEIQESDMLLLPDPDTAYIDPYLQQTGIADTSYWGPECEFYIFDSIRFDQNQHEGYYHIDAIEGQWNSGKD